jgi:hypothetical protein
MKCSLLLWALAVAIPLTATAQEARSTKWVNLRAGPARDYPLVARLGPGTPLAVQGCTGEVVMGTRGLGSLKGLILGSVTTKVIHLSKIPVTVVP